MQKIPTLFVRDFTAAPREGAPLPVLPEVTPGCEWVVAGEGIATRKWDGTCVMLDEYGAWWARREVKRGKPIPDQFAPISTDPQTGKTVGWEPVAQTGWAKYHAEAVHNSSPDRPGTYELLGPRINGNTDDYPGHVLMPHGWAPFSVRNDYASAPRDYTGLDAWLRARPYEGIVWHHDDGRMAKIKKLDFPGHGEGSSS
ncbi:hypothetical protein ACFY0G_17450 [Streptomyces sp. NPDC001552]|uniref:hypothetical protein n=1 Tax=Streptomyces sp. NPDC001552 TaxID=3364587 RepID=UPI00368EDAE9